MYVLAYKKLNREGINITKKASVFLEILEVIFLCCLNLEVVAWYIDLFLFKIFG